MMETKNSNIQHPTSKKNQTDNTHEAGAGVGVRFGVWDLGFFLEFEFWDLELPFGLLLYSVCVRVNA